MNTVYAELLFTLKVSLNDHLSSRVSFTMADQ